MTDDVAIDRSLIDEQLDHPDAERNLRTYFDQYTGGHFERFGGPGDGADVAHRFTPTDIVAVAMLSVRIHGRTVLELERKAPSMSALLSSIPTDMDLWDATDDVIGPGSPASELWAELERLPGSGWVTAGKLLARKRPRLIPVYDRVVKAELARPDNSEFWRPLRDVLRNNSALVTELQALRSRAGVGEDISTIRVLDVVIWMNGTRGRAEDVPPETE